MDYVSSETCFDKKMNFKNVVWFIKAMLLLLLKMKQQQHVDIECKEKSEKIWIPDGIWTHDPPWSSRML